MARGSSQGAATAHLWSSIATGAVGLLLALLFFQKWQKSDLQASRQQPVGERAVRARTDAHPLLRTLELPEGALLPLGRGPRFSREAFTPGSVAQPCGFSGHSAPQNLTVGCAPDHDHAGPQGTGMP